MKLAVIADDLTGANDTGVQFAQSGARAAVLFQGGAALPEMSLDVLVVDTDSRGLSPGAAAARVTRATLALGDVPILFKKIDSTLRGPLAAEVAAAHAASGRRRVIVAPAFPRLGRTTRLGVQLVHGTPVHETEAARDPRTPVTSSDLPLLFAELGEQVTVHDAGTDADLDAVVASVPDPAAVLWVGSAGLAEALGRRIFPAGAPAAAPLIAGPVLFVVGSLSAAARAQVDRLAQETGIRVMRLSLPVAPTLLQELTSELHLGRGVILTTAEDLPAGVSRDLYAEQLADALGESVRELTSAARPAALVLTGGDTAVHVARHLGATGVRLHAELAPGVALGTLIGPDPYPVVTKAGAFGTPETLLDIFTRLTKGEP